ncbi:MAG: helix-hairpin-helix domain-containing protein, partial [Bombella apis]|nr:helix-hairpin-helix domain-containing protein [Bombella apis]
VEDLAYADPAELHDIEGFDESVAEELMARANDYLAGRERALDERRRELGVTDDLVALNVFSLQVLVELGEKGIKTLDDLADLAADELIELLGGDEPLEEAEANEIIMAARAHWFDDEGASTHEAGDGAKAEGASDHG